MKKKMLQIVKYNKIIQDKLNLDINNYMRYSQIEIELTLSKKKYSKFINIQENKKNIIIYLLMMIKKKPKEII